MYVCIYIYIYRERERERETERETIEYIILYYSIVYVSLRPDPGMAMGLLRRRENHQCLYGKAGQVAILYSSLHKGSNLGPRTSDPT